MWHAFAYLHTRNALLASRVAAVQQLLINYSPTLLNSVVAMQCKRGILSAWVYLCDQKATTVLRWHWQ
jgi:hypothetical protein